MISKVYKCIFIHNFKTGGTSIEKKLGHFDTLERDVQDHRTLREIERLTDRMHFLRLAAYCAKNGKIGRAQFHLDKAFSPELTQNEFKTFYKFSFIRNSWARIYSWYANIMKDPMHRQAYKIEGPSYSFKDFLREKIDHKTFSQLYFLQDKKGKVAMDFIGRFENLQLDFNIVCEALKIEDSTLPSLLVRKSTHYTENYNEETKDLVYKLYKEEIDHFGFEYGE